MVKYTWVYMNLVDDILKDKLFDFKLGEMFFINCN
ncbi:hypothetical protein RSJ2_1990 [Clostridium botulinum]|nr:hypothetical protein T257_3373 [Clostridium botulinum CDC_297]AJE12886.1 hypothetical protein T259_2345 [Clostridium botulinum CDC_1436]APR00185.1 hypothetical protein RSJ2_1990 [Clostridium botulinum]